jgi:hypothetical protein
MKPRAQFAAVFVVCLLMSATPVLSAGPPLEKLTLELKDDGTGAKVTNPPQSPVVVKGATVPLEVTCAGVDCTKVSVQFAGQKMTMAGVSATSASTQLTLKNPTGPAGNDLSLSFRDKPVFEAQLSQSANHSSPDVGGTQTQILSWLCSADLRTEMRLVGALCLLYWLAVLVVRWNRIARPSRELLKAQITSLSTELEILAPNTPGGGLAKIKELLEAASDLIDRSKKASGYRVADFLFWSRGQELSGWGYVHEAEIQMAQFQPEATVTARLESVEQRLRTTNDAPCLALADAIHKALTGSQPAALVRLRALLAQGLNAVYRREDNSYADLVSWQNKASWLVGCGLILILALTGVFQHHAILLLVGGVGGLLSRLSRSLDRKDVPTDYGASWTTLFLSPVAGALGAWAGLLVTGLAAELGVLSATFKASFANPCDAKTLAIALVFGFSERMLDGVLDKVVGKSGIDQETPKTLPPPKPADSTQGAVDGRLAIPDKQLPEGTVGVEYDTKLKATGAAGPVKWSLTQGALPKGLQLKEDDGSITGKPIDPGSFSFTVEVTDQKWKTSQALAITVKPAPQS